LRYLFEDYALDTDRRELRRGADALPIAPQVFELIVFLIRNRERFVSKDELVAAVWDGRIITDSALTTRVYVARNAVGDTGGNQRLIKTLPRKGFRFVGAVREEQDRGRKPAVRNSLEPAGGALPVSDRPSIAVLAFTNLSDDPHHSFIAEGIAEDAVTELLKLRWLLVVSRNCSFNYKSKATDVGEVGRVLGIRYVLEGSMRRLESRTRVTAQLTDATTGAYICSESYDRSLSEILTRQDEIPEALAASIGSAIVRAERQRALRKHPEELGAWESYQRGMWHMSKCDAAENQLARTFFQRAVDCDPAYAPGYGALAWSHMMSASIYSERTVAEGCSLGEPLVRKAIALDNTDTEVRARLALAALLQGDLEGAFEAAQEVLTADPRCADALGVKGAALVYSGRRAEGRSALQQYLKLSPRDPARPIRLTQVAVSLYLDGGYDEAALTARQTIRQYPKHPFAYRWLAASLGQLGRVGEAHDVLQTLQSDSPSSFDMYVRRRPPEYCSAEYAPMLEGLRKAGWKE
jgi:TolB-like protein/cytochrome c-type biogenesis protein CcmH/NrfG